MDSSLCKFPDQPGLHRSKQQFSLFRGLSRPFDMIQNPLNLCRGKIGVNDQPRLPAVCLLQPFFPECIRNIGSAAALPDDRVTDRLSRFFVPDNGRLPLIRNSDRRYILRRCPDPVHRLHRHTEHCGPDLICIVLHPSRVRKILVKFLLRHRTDLPRLIKQDTAVARGPRVQRHNIVCHIASPPD